jgi:heat-inducible transcriptional repressor
VHAREIAPRQQEPDDEDGAALQRPQAIGHGRPTGEQAPQQPEVARPLAENASTRGLRTGHRRQRALERVLAHGAEAEPRVELRDPRGQHHRLVAAGARRQRFLHQRAAEAAAAVPGIRAHGVDGADTHRLARHDQRQLDQADVADDAPALPAHERDRDGRPREAQRAGPDRGGGQARPHAPQERGERGIQRRRRGRHRRIVIAAALTWPGPAATTRQMDARHRDVLVAIIREYIDGAEPVGSRVLSKRHFPHLSPATIRNAMADLEEMGYLAQPHTSAGRVPTDKAYRFYVDSFPPPQPGQSPGPRPLAARRVGIDGFMEQTSSHLSAVTRLTGLLLAPPLKHTTIARVDLRPLENDRALAVMVTDAGWLTVREITLEPPLGAEEVRALGRELTRRFRDRTVQEIVEMEQAPDDPLDTLHTRARAVTEQIVGMLRGRTLYVSGAINMLDHPEFFDIETTRQLLRTFEQKERLAEMMTTLAADEGVRVTIGDENPVSEMRECTLITSTYMYRDQVLGILGVVGPRRLPYPDVISAVDETARQVTEALSRVRQDLYLPS